MPCGILFRIVANPDGRPSVDKKRGKVGDIACVYRSDQCREDPAPESQFKILLISDAEPDELMTLCQERVDSKAQTFERHLCSLNTGLLPVAVQNAIQSRGRATCTKAEFLAATFNKEVGLQLSVAGIPSPALVRIAEKQRLIDAEIKKGAVIGRAP